MSPESLIEKSQPVIFHAKIKSGDLQLDTCKVTHGELLRICELVSEYFKCKK